MVPVVGLEPGHPTPTKSVKTQETRVIIDRNARSQNGSVRTKAQENEPEVSGIVGKKFWQLNDHGH
jgi:hypothetical protein